MTGSESRITVHGRVSPGFKPMYQWEHNSLRSPKWTPPDWAKPHASLITTTDVVFPGSLRREGEGESRTPDWLCLSMRSVLCVVNATFPSNAIKEEP
jgi:hypothetical protein